MTLGPESASVSPLVIFSPAGFSMRTTSPAETFSCFPPGADDGVHGAGHHKGYWRKVKPGRKALAEPPDW